MSKSQRNPADFVDMTDLDRYEITRVSEGSNGLYRYDLHDTTNRWTFIEFDVEFKAIEEEYAKRLLKEQELKAANRPISTLSLIWNSMQTLSAREMLTLNYISSFHGYAPSLIPEDEELASLILISVINQLIEKGLVISTPNWNNKLIYVLSPVMQNFYYGYIPEYFY